LWKRFNVHSQAELMPVLKSRYVDAVRVVESKDHRIFECLMGFLSFFVVSTPNNIITHPVELFYYALVFFVIKPWITGKERCDTI